MECLADGLYLGDKCVLLGHRGELVYWLGKLLASLMVVVWPTGNCDRHRRDY